MKNDEQEFDNLVLNLPWAFPERLVTRARQRQLARGQAIDLTEGGVLKFAEQYAPKLGEQFMSAPHLEAIAQRLEQSKRLLVVIPFRCGKSYLVARWYPLWLLIVHAGIRIILTAHTYELAADHGRWIQRTLETLGYDLTMSREHRLRLSNRSEVISVGMGGSLTGRGADVLIIDDPVKSMEQVATAHARDKAMEWLQSVALSRLSPGGQAVVCMTRWHEDDLAGRLINSKSWDSLIVRAQAEDDDPLGREPGEYLPLPWVPSDQLTEYWERRREDTSDRVWSMAYQCRPVPLEGAYFRSRDLEHIVDQDILDKIERIVIAVDPAVSMHTTADQAAIAVAGQCENKAVVLEVSAGKWGWDGLLRRIEDVYRRWGGELYIESQGVQTALLEVLNKQGIRTRALRPKGNKTQRASVLQMYAEQGRLLFLRTMSGYSIAKEELLRFPLGGHDDIVDALAYAVGELSRPKASAIRVA